MASNIYVGKRLSYDDAPCTVRYVGPVEGTEGDWIGVEWDNSSRGRNAGDAKGVKYFECKSKEAKPASFIRPARKPDDPRTFLEALKYKYASPDSQVPNKSGIAYEVGKQPIRISGKEVEEVGFEKINKQLAALDELKIVILDGLRVLQSHNGPYNGEQIMLQQSEIHDTCPKITQLDLGRNLFEELDEVGLICGALKEVTELKLDGNRFRETWKTLDQLRWLQKAFAKIYRLGLSQTLLSWDEILKTCACFQELSILSLSNNEISSLTGSIPIDSIQNLTHLILESNHIQCLADISPISSLNKLKSLALNFNNISRVSNDQFPTLIFGSKLVRVEFAFNEIGDWEFVNQLPAVFPGLENLRVSHNPLYNNSGRSVDDGFLLTIARIAKLKTLNYSPIAPKDRLEAETFYLAEIRKELEQVDEADESNVIARHPRFAELCEEYGAPILHRSKDTSNENLINFKFFERDDENDHYKPLFELSLFKYFSMYDLFFYAAQHLRTKPFNIHLYWMTKAQQAKLYRLENSTNPVKAENSSLEPIAGWATTEVELFRNVRLLDLVFYDEVNSIRVEIDPVIEPDDSMPVMSIMRETSGSQDFAKMWSDIKDWNERKMKEAKGARKAKTKS